MFLATLYLYSPKRRIKGKLRKKTSFRKIYFFQKSNYGKLRHLVGENILRMIEIYIIFLVVSSGEGPKQHRTMNKTFNMQII